jgi:hypothetical protein
LSQQAKTTALVALLYAGYAAMLVLSLVLFVTIVFFLVPPLTTGSTPTRRTVIIAATVPVVMLVLAAGALFPEALRTARGRAEGTATEAFSGAARGYLSCLVIIVGFSLASLLLSLPIVLIRLLFFS